MEPRLKNKKRKRLRLARLEIVGLCYKRAMTYRQIRTKVMAELGLKTYSLRTVKNDIDYLLNEWRENRLNNTDEIVEHQIAQTEYAIKELWDQWDKSKEDYAKRKAKKIGVVNGSSKSNNAGEDGDTTTVRREMEESNEVRLGDPRYISEIRQQQIELRKLLGLYAPEKSDVNVSGGVSVSKKPISLDEAKELLKQLEDE